MRDAFFEDLETKFKYKFGPNTFIIEAIAHHKNALGDGISYEVKLSGAELIEFIKKHAPGHEEIIHQIREDGHYLLTGWDW